MPWVDSPLGPLSVTEEAGRITRLDWRPDDRPPSALAAEALN